jgi:hypothetical protein
MPDENQLVEILLAKKGILPDLTADQRRGFVKLFNAIAGLVQGKKPATHELILWVWWMQKHGFTPDDIYKYDGKKGNETLLSSVSILTKETDDWRLITDSIKSNKIKK